MPSHWQEHWVYQVLSSPQHRVIERVVTLGERLLPIQRQRTLEEVANGQGTGVETLAEEDTYASNIVMNNEGSTSQRSSLRRSKFNTYRIRTNSTKSVNLHPVRRSSTNVQEQEQRQEPLCVVPDGSLAPAVSTTANQSQQLYNNEYNQQGDEASTSRDRIIKTFLPRNEGSRETFNSAEEELGKNGEPI